MHVHVDPGRIEFEKQDGGGRAAGIDQAAVGLADRVGQGTIDDGASVEEEMQMPGGRSGHRRSSDQAPDPDARVRILGFDFDEFGLELGAQDIQHTLPRFGGGREFQQRAVTRHEYEGDGGMRQRQTKQEFPDPARLGSVGLQELPPGGRAGEELADVHGGAGRTSRRLRTGHRVAFDGDASPFVRPGGTTGQDHPADGADRRQRLATKSHGGDGVQIIEGSDLAGGVGCHGQRQFIEGNAAAVVHHPKTFPPSPLDQHLDAGGPGIDRVLDQFLGHVGGSLDDFTGRDLVDEQSGERANGHGRIIRSGRDSTREPVQAPGNRPGSRSATVDPVRRRAARPWGSPPPVPA